MYWSFSGGYPSGGGTSPACGGDIDKLISEYSDRKYSTNLTPVCDDFLTPATFADKLEQSYSFEVLNQDDIQKGDYAGLAILRETLTQGLEDIQAHYDHAIVVTSAYRSPRVHRIIEDDTRKTNPDYSYHPKSRHILGGQLKPRH